MVTEEEALALWPKVQQWVKVNGRRPNVRSEDLTEKRYAEVLLFLQREKQERETARATKMADES